MPHLYDPRDVPALDTERLALRGPALDDFEDSAAMWGNPEVTRHIGGRPSSKEEVWARLLRYIGHWSLLGFGFWTIREKATGRFVGEVGLGEFRRDMVPYQDRAPEVGWVLMPWAHGKGFATEAARGALGWFGTHFGSVRTVCLIDSDNRPSMRVAEKCGFREFSRTTYKGQATILLER